MTTAQWIQLISSMALALLTGVLVWVTWTYVKATNKIADAAVEQSKLLRKDFERRSMPITEERVVQTISGGLDPEVELRIYNRGSYPVLLQEIRYEYYHAEHITDRLSDKLSIQSWIPSGGSWSGTLVLPFANIPQFNQARRLADKAFAVFEFKYLSIDNEEHWRPPLPKRIEGD